MKTKVMKLKAGSRILFNNDTVYRLYRNHMHVVMEVRKHGRFCKELVLQGVPEYTNGWRNWPVLDNHDEVEVL